MEYTHFTINHSVKNGNPTVTVFGGEKPKDSE